MVTLIYTPIVMCACLTCADIYAKEQADQGSLTPSEALQSEEIPNMLLFKTLTALRLEFCIFDCNEFSLLSF